MMFDNSFVSFGINKACPSIPLSIYNVCQSFSIITISKLVSSHKKATLATATGLQIFTSEQYSDPEQVVSFVVSQFEELGYSHAWMDRWMDGWKNGLFCMLFIP